MSVKYTSPPYSRYRVLIKHDVEGQDPLGGKKILERGIPVQFENHIAEVPDDLAPLVEAHPAFTGEGGHERVIHRWDDVMSLPRGINYSGPQVVDGALGAPTRAQAPPLPGWDEMTTRQITEATKDWPNAKIETALSWELGGRRRKMIVRALTDALLDDEAPEPPAPAPIAASFSAPLPEGRDGL